jgi:membrane protein DedA with SNARE-associated domain/rhodanese-related sulfurtransferase
MHDPLALLIEHGLLLVFLVTFAARLGAPVPAAPMMVVAGAMVVADQLSWPAAMLLSILANLLGDGAWFWAGRHHGRRVLRLLCRISISPDSCVRQSESFLGRWGGASLIAAKFVPGISVVAPPMAGALGMSTFRFVGYETLAATIWTGIMLGMGALFAVLVLVAAGYVGFRYWRRRKFLRTVEMPRISVAELQALMDGGHEPVVIDVRSEAAHSVDRQRLPGSIVIALGDIKTRAKEFRRDRHIVLYCNCPNEASAASGALLLVELGFDRVRPLAGGLDAWIDAGYRVL